MRTPLAYISFLALLGCANGAAERCALIAFDSIMAVQTPTIEEDLSAFVRFQVIERAKTASNYPWRNSAEARRWHDSVARVVEPQARTARADELRELERFVLKDFPSRWTLDSASDSAVFTVRPPLRPSESSWYAEHCFDGKAR